MLCQNQIIEDYFVPGGLPKGLKHQIGALANILFSEFLHRKLALLPRTVSGRFGD